MLASLIVAAFIQVPPPIPVVWERPVNVLGYYVPEPDGMMGRGTRDELSSDVENRRSCADGVLPIFDVAFRPIILAENKVRVTRVEAVRTLDLNFNARINQASAVGYSAVTNADARLSEVVSNLVYSVVDGAIVAPVLSVKRKLYFDSPTLFCAFYDFDCVGHVGEDTPSTLLRDASMRPVLVQVLEDADDSTNGPLVRWQGLSPCLHVGPVPCGPLTLALDTARAGTVHITPTQEDADDNSSRKDLGLGLISISAAMVATGLTASCLAAKTCRELVTVTRWAFDRGPVWGVVGRAGVNGLIHYAVCRWIPKGKWRTATMATLAVINVTNAVLDIRTLTKIERDAGRNK